MDVRVSETAGAAKSPGEDDGAFLADVVSGLGAQKKYLPCKYFYDERGSQLFEAICGLDEYYATRTETALIKDHGEEMADLIGPGASLIEYGCGSLVKTRLLLDALDNPRVFVPIDISEAHLMRSAAALDRDYPALQVFPVVADFTQPVLLPDATVNGGNKKVGFFPGSTIGNFDHHEAAKFLATVAETVGAGGGLLIGVDLKKDQHILLRAYDDRDGVTARFNLNIIERINRELGGDFDASGFRHEVRYNEQQGRIEMHLVSRREQTAQASGHSFGFRKGESIHTENSYKYDAEEFQALAAGQGFRLVRTWVDDKDLFSIHYLTRD
ncbi:MAG TPA: L-histidine N(alpha)-methyltransferase [Rhodospirillales bacterium]|jgi:dimethylhistidine N-methyltransferase|nr:L-histidine N(alpha)-methyltransferase [Rhodospirillales bacterium]